VGGVPTWLTALIAALGIVIGAVATGIFAVVAADRKVREIEVTYQQKLHENYLDNARAYTRSVYMPLATALTKLSAAFERYRAELQSLRDPAPAVERLYEAVGSFVDLVKNLQDQGAAAFLTIALENELEDLIAFLEASRGATTTRRRATIRLSMLGMSVEGDIGSPVAIWQARLASRIRYLPFLLAPRVKMLKDRVVAADPLSPTFEVEFGVSVTRLRILIKEVTLGAHASR
jgi:hypothetical protein